VLAVAAGVVAIRGIGPAAGGRAVGLALVCGATVAAYTLVDNEGLRHAGPVPYLALVLAPPALLALLVARRSPAAGIRSSGRTAVAAGVGMVGAYVLTLAALNLAAAAPVAAVREASVLIAVVAAAVVGRERLGGVRLAAAAAITAGIGAIALG
jgi:drug/metabolite transporter (DMT)-like permease